LAREGQRTGYPIRKKRSCEIQRQFPEASDSGPKASISSDEGERTIGTKVRRSRPQRAPAHPPEVRTPGRWCAPRFRLCRQRKAAPSPPAYASRRKEPMAPVARGFIPFLCWRR
jgi:hypothetical protein